MPEELKPAYKQMQAAFTKKTQEIANERKQAQDFKAKAEGYAKYERYIPLIDEMMAKQQTQGESPEMQALTQRLKGAGYSEEAVEMMKVGAQFTLDQFGKFNQTQEAQKQTEFVTNRIGEAGKLDPRLNDQSLVYQTEDGKKVTYGQVVEELVAADPDWVKDPVIATQKAIKKVDALIGKAKLDGKQELSAKAKGQAARFPQVKSSPQGAAGNNQPKTIQEAYKQAKEELGL